MLIVLTAGTSFLGRHLLRCLTDAGHEVVVTYRSEPVPASRQAQANALARFVRLDLADADAIGRRLPGKVDCIVHVAGVSAGSGITLADMIRCNVLGTANLLEYGLRAEAAKLIHASTLSVHGRILVPEVNELTPSLDPGTYGASKLLGERLMAEVSDRLPALVLRLPGTLGEGAHRAWIPVLADRLRRNLPVTIYNPAAPFNNAAHVHDIGALILQAIAREWQGFHALPIGASGMTTVGGVVEILKGELGSCSEILTASQVKPSFTINSTVAMRQFGYAPMDMVEMLRRYAAEVAVEDE